MIYALGFVPGNAGWGVAFVESDDVAAARAMLAAVHGRDDFVRIILLKSSSPIGIVGNWCEEFNLNHASIDEFAALIDGTI